MAKFLIVFLISLAACKSSDPPASQSARAERPQDVLAHTKAQDAVVRGLSHAVGQAYRRGDIQNARHATDPAAELLRSPTILTMVFAANTHGEVDDCGCKAHPLGGIARRVALVVDAQGDQERWKKRPWAPANVFSVDAGDLLFKHVTVDRTAEDEQKLARYEAQTMIDVLNAAPPAAVLAGELDFALGLDTFTQLTKGVKFPIISANLMKDGQPLLPGYVVVDIGGKRVAIIGLTKAQPARSDYWESKGLVVNPPLASYRAAYSDAKDADVVVLLSNLGIRDSETLIGELTAQERPSVVVVSGSNALTREPLWVQGVPLVEPLSQGKMVGRADLVLNGVGHPQWVNARPDLKKVSQAYRRAWSTYAATRQRYNEVRRNQAENELQLAKVKDDAKRVAQIQNNNEFLGKEIERVRARIKLVSEDLVAATRYLTNGLAAQDEPAIGDDWFDLQIIEATLDIVGPKAVQSIVDRRGKKRPKP